MLLSAPLNKDSHVIVPVCVKGLGVLTSGGSRAFIFHKEGLCSLWVPPVACAGEPAVCDIVISHLSLHAPAQSALIPPHSSDLFSTTLYSMHAYLYIRLVNVWLRG